MLTGGRLGPLARSSASTRAFADFYEEHSPDVLRYFARQTRDAQAAFDLMEETFCRAFEKRHDFRGSSDEQAAAWLWSIARNELSRFRRSKSVEFTAMQRLGLERPPKPSDEELCQVERLIATESLREQISVALDMLSPDQQEVIRLRYEEELTDQEIAERLSVSHDVVRARASRALRKLDASGLLKGTMELFDA